MSQRVPLDTLLLVIIQGKNHNNCNIGGNNTYAQGWDCSAGHSVRVLQSYVRKTFEEALLLLSDNSWEHWVNLLEPFSKKSVVSKIHIFRGYINNIFYTLVANWKFFMRLAWLEERSKEAQNFAFLYSSLDTETEQLTSPSEFASVIPRNSKIYMKIYILLWRFFMRVFMTQPIHGNRKTPQESWQKHFEWANLF